jgi:hypothetical protein
LSHEIRKLENPELGVVLHRMIDAYVNYLDAHADFRTISFGRHVSSTVLEEPSGTGLSAILGILMFLFLGLSSTPELRLRLCVASEAGERLIAYACEQPTGEERDLVIAETKKMLARYLFPSN